MFSVLLIVLGKVCSSLCRDKDKKHPNAGIVFLLSLIGLAFLHSAAGYFLVHIICSRHGFGNTSHLFKILDKWRIHKNMQFPFMPNLVQGTDL
jgi:hypothetical protein